MKKIKKIVSLCLAMVMCLGLSVTAASAAGTGTGKITVNKAQVGNTYTLYKVFDAASSGDGISYKLVSGKTTAPEGFTVDSVGNVTYNGKGLNGDMNKLTADDIEAIAGYVSDSDVVETKTAESDTVEFTGLTDGYYYITTTTGTLVTINSVKNKTATVEDKNEAPVIDKKSDESATDAKQDIAGVGDSVPFTATIDVKKGAKNYVFKDTMKNMKFAKGAEIKVSVGGTEVAASDNTYKLATTEDTLLIEFNNEWIKSQAGKQITIKYSAIITSDALTTTPATNEAKLEYGNGATNISTPSEVVKVYNATITVNKKDGNNNSPLAGAFFVLQNSEGKYYKAIKDTDGKITGIEWVERENADVLETTTDNNCTIEFKGLDNGVYTLIETKAPDGYNTAEDKTITIEDGNYNPDNLHQTKDVMNLRGTQLPSTGGMGTTIFYVVGGIMVLGAAVLMVTKRRVNSAK